MCHIFTTATHFDQYGRPVTTNPVPPVYNRQPHGKQLVYTHEN